MSPIRSAAAALLLLVASGPPAPARADIRPLTLYQKSGRASWVIVGEVTDMDDRFAAVKVVEVVKGTYDQPAFRIVYRLENFLRKSWEEKLEFKLGERAIFFLKRYETDKPGGEVKEKLRAEDMFASAFGAQGKFTLPEEGWPAYVAAVKEFVRVTEISETSAQESALLSFLVSENPHVLVAGLVEVLDRHLAGEPEVPLLLRLTDAPRDEVRLNAMQILGQVATDLHVAGRTLENQEDVVARVKGVVVGPGNEVLRAEAVKVVAAFALETQRPFLERLAKEDPSQLVRYEASRALMSVGKPR